MNTSSIVYYVLLAVLIISAGVSYYYNKYYYMYILGGLAVLTFILVFLVIWREDYNVHPNNIKQDYNKKVLWINVDKLDINNEQHIEWSKKVLIKQAPNKLGIYSDKYNVTKLDILRYIETFYELFGYNSEYIYFENAKLNNKTKKFCKDKNLKINSISFRINNK